MRIDQEPDACTRLELNMAIRKEFLLTRSNRYCWTCGISRRTLTHDAKQDRQGQMREATMSFEPDTTDPLVARAVELRRILCVTSKPSNVAFFVTPDSRPSKDSLAGRKCGQWSA